MLDPKLLEVLVCPATKGKLIYDKENNELLSLQARLAYPVNDDMPVMLENEARELKADEIEKWRSK